jgi:hypothetical protein
VRVRSAAEIFSTLDEKGAYDGLPFMPTMLKFCGRTLPVGQRSDVTCAGVGEVWRMRDTVHLKNVRCDGSAYDGCQAACLMFWKEAWLERVEKGTAAARGPATGELTPDEAAYVEDVLQPATKNPDNPEHYRCQATDIRQAATKLRLRDVDQFVDGFKSWKAWKIIKGLPIEVFNLYQAWSYRNLPKWLRISSGRQYPFMTGPHNKGETPPSGQLNLQPGDLVRIKPMKEIVATLDKTNRHRGLSFDGELSRFCGKTARVKARINRIIEEQTGEMIEIKSDCIMLEDVYCISDYHRFCTRAIPSYWRELWLEKIESGDEVPVTAPCVNRWSKA